MQNYLHCPDNTFIRFTAPKNPDKSRHVEQAVFLTIHGTESHRPFLIFFSDFFFFSIGLPLLATPFGYNYCYTWI